MYNLSPAEWVTIGLLSCLWAFFGYRLSENDRKRLGRTPWGLPSAVWALFWFLSLLIGAGLYLIAHANGIRRAQQQGIGIPGMGGQPQMGRARAPARELSVSDQFPAYPRPANTQSQQPDPVVEDPQPVTPPADGQSLSGARPQSPAGWHPDPSGRFHYRWWDGNEWTSQVSMDGQHLIDTNPDQRIGPY